MSAAYAGDAVLFDLDGTLLNTAPHMACAINALRVEEGATPLPFAAVRPFVSHGAIALTRLAFPDAVEPDFNVLRERFLAIYRNCLANETRLFDGAGQLLTELEDAHIPWGIVTNKPGWLTEPLLEALGLRARTGALVCGDTLAERKPHPRPLLHAATQLGIAPERCVYVGDAERDIIAARAAGMYSVAARFGYIGAAEDVAAWAADAHIDAPLEVLNWVRRAVQ